MIKTVFKFKKEISISILGVFCIGFILSNLRQPHQKRALSSLEDTDLKSKEASPTQQAAQKVEEEQEQQSLQLSTFKSSYAKLFKTELCIEDQTCNYPNNDPREYSLSVFKDLSLQLEEFKPLLVSNWFRLNNKTKSKVISLVRHEDGFVKEKILDLLLDLPDTEARAHLNLVLDDVIDHHNSELIPKAFELLKKISTPENEMQVAKRLALAISNGGPHVSQAMSKHIPVFITPNTSEVFKEVLSTLPKQAAETDFLTSALTEFELQESGG